MSRAEDRNGELSRAAILIAAGGAIVALSQRAPELSIGLLGKILLVLGGVVVAGGLILAVRSLLRR